MQVDYDPAKVSYETLLTAFWKSHSPTFAPYSLQYRSAIFYITEKQKELAVASKKQEEARLGKPIYTDIEAFKKFYLAEDYHQKYYLLEIPIIGKEITGIYPETSDLINSTAAARLNGYLSGYGDQDILNQQIDKFGLSKAGQQKLLDLTASGLAPLCPVP